MAACMLCRFLQSCSGSTHLLKRPLGHRSSVLKDINRSAWYRSFFQSDPPASAPQSVNTESTKSLSSSKLTKPKQPPNVFLLYISKIQDDIKKHNPDASRQDVLSEASKRWKELDPEEKSKIGLERKEMYEEFKEARRQYLDNMTPEQIQIEQKEKEKKESKKLKKARKILGMPEKPWSSYKWFMSERFAERNDENIQTFFKQSKDLWTQLSPKEKEVYQEKHKVAQEKYQRDMMNWEESMIEEGRFDVLRKSTLAALKHKDSKERVSRKKNKIIETQIE